MYRIKQYLKGKTSEELISLIGKENKSLASNTFSEERKLCKKPKETVES